MLSCTVHVQYTVPYFMDYCTVQYCNVTLLCSGPESDGAWNVAQSTVKSSEQGWTVLYCTVYTVQYSTVLYTSVQYVKSRTTRKEHRKVYVQYVFVSCWLVTYCILYLLSRNITLFGIHHWYGRTQLYQLWQQYTECKNL